MTTISEQSSPISLPTQHYDRPQFTYYDFTIENYQIISPTQHIEFHTGLTLITGKSNNGKTSIIKALKQLTYNHKPPYYITHLTQHTHLTLQHLHEPTTGLSPSSQPQPIYRIDYHKTPQSTKYTLTHHTPSATSTTHLTNVGLQQPQQVSLLTHIDRQLNLNFWDQLTQPFLLSLTPSQQFTQLNNTPTTLHIQNILTQIKQDTQHTNQSLSNTQSNLTLLHSQHQHNQQQLTSLSHITTLHDNIHQLQPDLQRLTSLHTQLTQYHTTQSKIHQLTSQLHSLPDLTTLTSSLISLQPLITKINTLTSQLTSLKNTVPKINTLTQQIQDTQTQLTNLSQFLTQNFTTCPLCNQPLPHPPSHN